MKRHSRSYEGSDREHGQREGIATARSDAGVCRMSEAQSRAPSPWRRAVRRPFSWFDEGLDWFEQFVLVTGIAAMAIVSVINVISRNTIGSSLQFATDVTQLLLVIVTFMGIGIGARNARHIRVSAIHDLLPEPAQKVLLVIVGFGTSALLFLLADYGWDYAQSVQRSCRVLPESIGSTPLWLGVALTLVAMVLSGHLIRIVAAVGQRLVGDMTPARRNLAILAALAVAFVVGAFLFGLFIDLVENRSGRCRVTSSTGFPVYLIYMVVPLGFFLGAVQFFLAGLRNLVSRDNYLSWYHRDEYESEEQAAEQTSFGNVPEESGSSGASGRGGDHG
ncbi:TRAP transporter small permease [Wenzhouxiangella sediminis]|uniref:TRAP transporter small permease protein n=1 Tax=Wenzhouxiangella sediminis TaxID=1792836 RepID=A0A3E1K4Y8_9GAMM|nr:TRAP transporter small permease [Wenzhouxiangella sediminis]RFF29137.1 TRAP transporter small permease [Wenzhouxiangella sediminis]